MGAAPPGAGSRSQGGSHILLEVDTNAVRKEKLDAARRPPLVRDRLGSPPP
jgi:hypothetical protein